MEELIKILAKIEGSELCVVSKFERQINKLTLKNNLPDDLRYYLENYSSIVLFENAEYPIKIVGLSDFEKANPVIVGEDVEDDISNNWYIIADDGNSQYITIDLALERLGQCYDSFWDRHGVVGEQAVVAKSFTELLERLCKAEGKSWYWTDPGFQSYGDAYDEQ